MKVLPVLALLGIVMAGCAAPLEPAAPSTPGAFSAGDEAVYTWDLGNATALVRMRVVEESAGILRWEQMIDLDGEATFMARQWVDADGQVVADNSRGDTVWYTGPCAAGWLAVASTTCDAWVNSLREDGTTAIWRPVETHRTVVAVNDTTVTWRGGEVPVHHWSVAVTTVTAGEGRQEFRMDSWFSDRSCFPLAVVDGRDQLVIDWRLLGSRCGGESAGEALVDTWNRMAAVSLADLERQPRAGCSGRVGVDADAADFESAFDCGIYDAFGLFWMAPGQGLRVTADWVGASPVALRLEVDGIEMSADAPPIILEVDSFSAPLDEVVIRLHDDGAPFHADTPAAGRPVSITLEGYALG